MLVYLAMIDSPEDQLKFERIYEKYRYLMLHVAKQILQNHHDYLREIHAGNDVAYLAERERRREQYIKPLKEIQ